MDRAQSIPRVKNINRIILAEEQRLRAAHPWLAHQDAIGLTVFIAALAAIAVVAALYLSGLLPGLAAVLLIALPLSLLHELEHDLIHELYFRDTPWMQDLLFLGIFLSKMSMDPWTRRRIHLRHHRVSGQPDDIEERLIGLGLPLGLKRLLITVLPVLTVILWPDIRAGLRAAHGPQQEQEPSWRGRSSPGRIMARILSTGFVLLPLVVIPAALLGSRAAMIALVLYVAPNLLRHAAIAFISSSSHYYGDIPQSAVYFQNQILDHWLTWPLQVFCFNFGATHILHHYVVRQPFYLRQLIAPGVRDALVAEGVRRNDLGTFRRANRWSQQIATDPT